MRYTEIAILAQAQLLLPHQLLSFALMAVVDTSVVVDTSTSTMCLYTCLSATALVEAEKGMRLTPRLYMVPDETRWWIPLHNSYEEALQRAILGAEERSEKILDPKSEFRILRVEFTALGFGHYSMRGMLTTYDHRSWRFRGEIPFVVRSATGELLVSIDANVQAIL